MCFFFKCLLLYLRNVKSRSICAVVFRFKMHAASDSSQFSTLTFSNLPTLDPGNQRNRSFYSKKSKKFDFYQRFMGIIRCLQR